MAWADQTGTASIYYRVNPDETIWDGGSTFWDLNGNIYDTVWDDKDNSYSAATTNTATWSDV